MINEKRITDSMIYQEMKASDAEYYFDYKRQKFLHNIDTFYYSVKLNNDMTKNSDDIHVKRFREYFAEFERGFDTCISLNIPGITEVLNFVNLRFGFFYNICLEVPEMFDIFIADTVPGMEDDEDESVTSEIIVQIRSYCLWELGTTKAFEKSYAVLKKVLDYFDLTILEVKENRVDYCWHSNYLQNPSQFFRIDNFVKMNVSKFKRIRYEYQFKPNDEYENDYICLGVRKNNTVFVRIYLKSKEVIEEGYKPWFFNIWFFNSLISRYDLYIYEECYKQSSWNYVDLARLKFYSEYGTDEFYKSECDKVVRGIVTMSADKLSNLADKLTPRVTLITNVEYQVMRKHSKSYVIKEFKDNEKYGVCKRIYDFLDNRYLINEYLTHSTLRLVQPDAEDVNKSRRDYCHFWKRLRECKLVDVYIPKAKIKLTREYSRNLNKEVVKKRVLNGCVTYGLYERGINDDSVFKDCAAALLRLNDNDIFNMKRYKDKKKKQLYSKLYDSDITQSADHEFELLDVKSGEVINERM